MFLDPEKPIPTQLLAAILAVGSKQKTVWDEKPGLVRAARPEELLDALPTFTEQELSQLRREFVKQNCGEVTKSERSLLLEWAEGRLSRRNVPAEFWDRWRKHSLIIVRERLERHFEGLEIRRGYQQHSGHDIEPGLAFEAPAPNEEEAADDQLVSERKNAGDTIGVGEALAKKFSYVGQSRLDAVLANVVATWASPVRLAPEFESTYELGAQSHEFVSEYLSLAFVHAYARLRSVNRSLPAAANDLVFRLADSIASAFTIGQRLAPVPLATHAVVRLESELAALRGALTAFQTTNALTAKSASIEVVRAARNLSKFTLPNERPILANIDRLLGPVFRKFCESCDRHDDADVIRRVPEIREQLAGSVNVSNDPRAYSRLWQEFVQPVFRHIEVLLDEGLRRSEIAASPSLALADAVVKLNLTGKGPQVFSCRLINHGDGRGLDVVGLPAPQGAVQIAILEPSRPFELGGRSEQFVTFGITLAKPYDRLDIPLSWKCRTAAGANREFQDQLVLEQQRQEPDWEKLRDAPPYTTKPIQHREQLFGRQRILENLLLHVAAGTSTFLWGQKRVGKTSVLQVLASELNGRVNSFCLILRMGELVGMHEGQIAHTIARRLNELAHSPLTVPSEAEFGAAMGHLVPFIERLMRAQEGNYVVIVDEFDDLDPAYYLGERGRQFIKALRSLSEVGLTFFFVGSERMEAIYQRHQEDLNKWLDVSLSRIESAEDCQALAARPVSGAIEYDVAALRRIVEYCSGNPFYMQVFCFEIFKRCLQGRRTFVGESDVIAVADALAHSLGHSNFAHFWLDNPELDQEKRNRQAAENCLVLVCLARLSGAYENVEDLHEVQEKLGLAYGAQLSLAGIREIVDRLRRRDVLSDNPDRPGARIDLPMFRDWLNDHAELVLLHHWQEFCSRPKVEERDGSRSQVMDDLSFPISEDDLLAVSQRLVYCGKQKDVAEVRAWLRQFDDDSRIEVAFLLLKRMAEKGYMSEGERVLAMNRLQEAVQAIEEGEKRVVWRIVRGRHDNLCVTFVDSETKSGASTAREVAKILRPSKCAGVSEIGNWLRDHLKQDAVLLIVDDFAGTGGTIVKGLEHFSRQRSDEAVFREFYETGAVHLFVLFAFPDAMRAIQRRFPKLRTTAIRVFGEDVRGLDPEANIFSDAGERKFAQDILLQIGRQLTPQTPLGHGDMAALVGFHNTIPNNTLPIFWSNGRVNERRWNPLFPRASWS